MKKVFKGNYGKVSIVKVREEECMRTEYTRITGENVKFKIIFLQSDKYDTIQLIPKIVDIDGTEWYCYITIIKSKNSMKCSACLGSVCNTNYTDISKEDYNNILNAFLKPLM